MRKRRSVNLEWEQAGDVRRDIEHILSMIDMPYVDISRIFCYRTEGSSSRSYARIWSFPKIFQNALGIKPAYVIEVLATYYDQLPEDEKKKVLIHELLHIPKNFSGALLPHRTRSRNLGNMVNAYFKQYKKASRE